MLHQDVNRKIDVAQIAGQRTMDLKALSNSSSSSVALIRSSIRAASLSDISSSFAGQHIGSRCETKKSDDVATKRSIHIRHNDARRLTSSSARLLCRSSSLSLSSASGSPSAPVGNTKSGKEGCRVWRDMANSKMRYGIEKMEGLSRMSLTFAPVTYTFIKRRAHRGNVYQVTQHRAS